MPRCRLALGARPGGAQPTRTIGLHCLNGPSPNQCFRIPSYLFNRVEFENAKADSHFFQNFLNFARRYFN
jgi:hypothetical protein